MAAWFVDIDRTFAQDLSLVPSPGWVEGIHSALDAGHQIIFTTGRTDRQNVERMLRKCGIAERENVLLIMDVQNPRVLINDEGALALPHPPNAPWMYDQFVR